jgi:hypothetical protein
MSGLFKLTLWKGVVLLDSKKIFAMSLRGALSIAGKLVEQHPVKDDVDFACVRSLENVDLTKRRYYDAGKPISKWIDGEVMKDEL